MLNGGKVDGKRERIFEKEKDSDLEGVGKQEGESVYRIWKKAKYGN